MDKFILRLTIVWLAVALVSQLVPYRRLEKYAVKLGTEIPKRVFKYVEDADEVEPPIVANDMEHTILLENSISIQQADIMGLVPYNSISSNEINVLNEYIKSTLAYGQYATCILIEYTRDEENNSNCYHFTWDDKRYTCIYITEGHNVPLLLYDVEITDEIIKHWETV